MDYILRADNPSKLVTGKVYLTESGSWSNKKLDAKVFTAKTRATEAKESAPFAAEIVIPNFEKSLPVEDAV